MTKELFDVSENIISESIKISEFCEKCSLDLISGKGDDIITFSSKLVNRPGLLFTGFDAYFGNGRVQILGNAEYYYLESLDVESSIKAWTKLCSKEIPCIIVARDIKLPQTAVDIAKANNVPLMYSKLTTTAVNNLVAGFLEDLLAPSKMVHGTLLDIDGLGVLISGDSGMGKSETALELIHRGHRLIADDAVIVKKINETIIGHSPENIKFYMEVRGIGIIDVRSLFGVGSVLNEEEIHLIIELVKWEDGLDVERLGNSYVYDDILGIKIPKITMPVMPGRNLAIVVEVAARNQRMKSDGVDVLSNLIEKSGLKE